jgi:hypothetical protein
MSVIFTKTQKGTEEMTNRSGGLTPRVRRVLIMIDGKRSVADLQAMALADDLSHTLGELEEAGFIELVKTAETPPPAANGGLPAITTFRDIPPTPDLKELDMARNFITNTLKTFCGPATHLSIVEKVFAAKTHEEMREQFAPWFNAILETSAGRRRAEELRSQLLKVI